MSNSHLHKLLLHKLSTSFEELLNCTQHDVCLCVMDVFACFKITENWQISSQKSAKENSGFDWFISLRHFQ